MGDYGGQVIDGDLSLICAGPTCSVDTLWLFSPVTEHRIGIDILDNRQNFYIGSLIHGVRAFMVVRA